MTRKMQINKIVFFRPDNVIREYNIRVKRRPYHCHSLRVDVLLKPKFDAIVRDKL